MSSPHVTYNILLPIIEEQIRVAPMINKGMVSEEDVVLENPRTKTIDATMNPSNTAGIVFLIFVHLSTMD
jgi:hypothetical protein